MELDIINEVYFSDLKYTCRKPFYSNSKVNVYEIRIFYFITKISKNSISESVKKKWRQADVVE